MSSDENHRYLLRLAVRRPKPPLLRSVLVWLVVIALLLVGYQAGVLDQLAAADPLVLAPVIVTSLLLLIVGSSFAIAHVRARRMRSAWRVGIAQPGPERLLDVVTRSLRPLSAFPDGDAHLAVEQATVYALYGRGEDAERILGSVNWASKAPIIRALGLRAEGLVSLLCRRDTIHALERTRAARSLAEISPILPGSDQSRRYHRISVALGEVASGPASAESLAHLEEAAADARYPALQLLAAFGLVLGLEGLGQAERASRVRAELRRKAPHCTFLHLGVADFAEADPTHG